ncbi:fimbrial protein [Herbaspirillum sp.]|uniref:fimbrial protein n=1 Tax=Herbaspirillum sp. TaxID=1890675 RepID=UPI001B2A33DD|nr:fimbrial protein [Herbaspirillum sp.]MBO9537922.1 type 1 fimbrial protein [Herbaspirillum sp.]
MWNRNESIARIAARLGLMLLIWMSAGAANAQTVCRYNDDNPYGAAMFNAVAPLNITALTIGRDVPDGTELYRQTIYGRGQYRLYCPAAVTSLVNQLTLPVKPKVLSSWNTGTYAGKTYETGVAGIGVAIWRGSVVFEDTFSSANNGNTVWGISSAFDISLIKIGPVSPGVITGANLPTAQFGINGIVLARTRFTGNIQIVSQTCTTPDVTVPLGEYKVSDFPTVGSATPWKDFSIRLQNCPAFYGRSASLRNTDSAAGWVESNKTLNPNVLQFSLEPTNGTAAIYPGTVRLSPAASGPASATGIGVQIVDPSLTPVKFLTQMPTNITPTAVSGASYTIPLQARYIRITGTLAPGPANAAVMFTINYQ